MRILVDVDFPLAPLYSEWYGRYNKDWDDNLSPERVTNWRVHDFVKPECGKDIYKYLLQPDLYDNLIPTEGSLEAITFLKSNGYEVVYATSGIHRGKYEFLRRYGFLESEAEIVFAQNKNLIKGDILVDDYDQNIATFEGVGILMDAPHNRHYETLYRAMNWEEVVAFIIGL